MKKLHKNGEIKKIAESIQKKKKSMVFRTAFFHPQIQAILQTK
jgi:hypothetical protein